MQQKREGDGAKNKADGEAFLAKNKNNPGVVTLTDGLQYKVITDGNGPIPSSNDIVTVNYRGTLIDGTEFDSSAKTGQSRAIQCQPCYSRLDGSAHAHESRFQMAIFCSIGTRLRRTGRPRHPAQCRSDF